MRLIRARSCLRCRAFTASGGGSAFGPRRDACELGYRQRKGRPMEPCPRPLTCDALVEAPKRWELADSE